MRKTTLLGMNGLTRNRGRSAGYGSERFITAAASLPEGLDVPLFDLYGAGFHTRSSARMQRVMTAMRKVSLDSPEARITRAWQDVGLRIRNAISLYDDGFRNSAKRDTASL